ncbi:MAG: hypothetical protein HUK40_02340 [Desulfobacter sp.]|nr:hypothetical protein [Desulfobacter sp.]WDP85347.1 MAG: hypothetical protein HUN05_09565 [Desulfobacter sp.]
MLNFMEAVPLSVFLVYIRYIDASIPGNWKLPFIVSGIAALVLIFVWFLKKRGMNPLFLGINLYLLSGAMAFIGHQWWLPRIYNDLEASGMLLWIIVVGIFTTLLSPGGFVGTPCSCKNRIRKYSVYLLMAACVGFGLSWGFQGDKLLSEIIPFAGLFFIQNRLKYRLNTL